MSEPLSTSRVEIARVNRVPGLDTTLRLELTSGGESCDVSVKRCLNPTLFDFVAKHAAIIPAR